MERRYTYIKNIVLCCLQRKYFEIYVKHNPQNRKKVFVRLLRIFYNFTLLWALDLTEFRNKKSFPPPYFRFLSIKADEKIILVSKIFLRRYNKFILK